HGTYGRFGELALLVDIDAIGVDVPLPERARVRVITRDPSGALVETQPTVSPHDFGRLVATLRSVGFPRRTPNLTPVTDTEDGWAGIRLQVQLDGVSGDLELHLASSGFKGTDAQPWRTVFHDILRVTANEWTPEWARIE